MLSTMQRLFPFSCGDACNAALMAAVHANKSTKSTNSTKSTKSTMAIGSNAICGRRKHMEDRHSIVRDIVNGAHYIGVFDGHGGPHVATGCAAILADSVRESLCHSKERPSAAAALSTALKQADVCGLASLGADLSMTGSTATMALIDLTHITVCHIGDSCAYLLRGHQLLAMSRCHKPSRPDERDRIKQAGGFISCTPSDKTERVQGVLAISRAIGDHKLRPFVSGEPDVRAIERSQDDKILLIATDGLWDVVTPREAMEIAGTVPQGPAAGEAIASLLVQVAYDRKSKDNITVVAVVF